ncbi:MAG: hypothetical protein J5714_03940 [Alphaproteobacteria bacterium]|nr:hypothetical protein [Alphaproteobacteria bacterium]
MQIEPVVTFVVKYAEPENYGREQTVNDIDGLKQYINCQGLGQHVSYALNVARQVYFIAVIANRNHQYKLAKNDGKDIQTDAVNIIVAKKLTYLSDLQEYVKKNALGDACQDVNWKNFAQFDTTKPIFFTGPYEHNGSFLPDAPVRERPLVCRPLTDSDIVVDKDLKQLWPTKTNEIPSALRAMFRKKTEMIK